MLLIVARHGGDLCRAFIFFTTPIANVCNKCYLAVIFRQRMSIVDLQSTFIKSGFKEKGQPVTYLVVNLLCRHSWRNRGCPLLLTKDSATMPNQPTTAATTARDPHTGALYDFRPLFDYLNFHKTDFSTVSETFVWAGKYNALALLHDAANPREVTEVVLQLPNLAGVFRQIGSKE